MQEKDIVLDVLSSVKSGIGEYAKVITETADPTLRQTFQQMRDGDEKFQYDLYNIAAQKGYYVVSPNAAQQDLTSLKSTLSQRMAPQGMPPQGAQPQGMGQMPGMR
ncbi:MAG: spore coat protein [Clostridiales bacterium]|jgi:spore coat protein CotF|nr:spore coat protein [Clostridiales bacterium]